MMRDGCYPSRVIDHPAKVAVVLGTYVPVGQVEEVSGRRRIKPFKNGQEYLPFVENKLDLIKFNLACHGHYNAGIDYELVIIDNSSQDQDTVIFLEQYAKEHGAVFISREDTGFSHGAFDFVWRTFRNKYDYYMFHEQDFVPNQDGWLSVIVQKFLSERNIGAVGNVVEGWRSADSMLEFGYFKKEYLGDYFLAGGVLCNLDGHWLFTSCRILEECGFNVTFDGTGEVNELIWLHNILNAGYKLTSFYDGNHKFTNGICYIDFDIESDKLAPLCHGQTLYCNTFMRDYFNWYENLKDFHFVE